MLFLTRQTRNRPKILRAVYEDNLRIIGKKSSASSWKIPFLLKGQFLFFFIVLSLVFGNAGYLDSTFRAETHSVIQPPVIEERYIPEEYFSMINSKDMPLKQVFGLGVKTIVIDPGHGGSDPGTAGKLGLKEKDIALDIAKRLRVRLLGKQYNVILTRENDETVPLTRRTAIANSNNADLFISIHVNYLPSKPINIIETYYFGIPDNDETLRLASKENADSHYTLSEFKAMIEKIGDTLKLQESRKLASFIQNNLFLNIRSQNKRVLNYGTKRAPFVVLLGTEMPGVLTEVSCLSNKDEELKLFTERYRDDIAQYIESGILNYLKKGEPIYEAKRSRGK